MIDELSHFDAAHRLLEFEDELYREGTLASEFQKKVRQQERALLAEKKKLKSDLFKTIALNYETWWD
jgi:Skp family chaperone for outer membrane proteins